MENPNPFPMVKANSIGIQDLDQALEYFKKASETGDMWITFLAVDQRFNYLRMNPEFVEIVRSTGLDLN